MAEPANRSSYASERLVTRTAVTRVYVRGHAPELDVCKKRRVGTIRWHVQNRQHVACCLQAVEGDNDGAAGTYLAPRHGALQRRQVHTIMPEVSRSLAPFLLGLVPLIAASNIACTRSVAVTCSISAV